MLLHQEQSSCEGSMAQEVSTAREMAARMIQRHRGLIPMYHKAVREENLQDLLLARHEMAAAVEQVDRTIADCIVKHIQRRLAEG
jgi:hypothetical protein